MFSSDPDIYKAMGQKDKGFVHTEVTSPDQDLMREDWTQEQS